MSEVYYASAIQCQLLTLASVPPWNALRSATAKTSFVLLVSKTPQHDYHQQEADIFKNVPKSTNIEPRKFFMITNKKSKTFFL